MQIDKNMIMDFLKSQGQHDKAQQADSELPQQVDTDEHAGMLNKLGINPMDLVKQFTGGGGSGGGGGIGGAIGGMLGR